MASFAFGAALTGTQDGLKFSSSLRVLGGRVVSACCVLTSAGGALWTSVCGWSSEAVLEQYPHKSRLEPRKQPWGSLRHGTAAAGSQRIQGLQEEGSIIGSINAFQRKGDSKCILWFTLVEQVK